jgi:hypothetical protein
MITLTKEKILRELAKYRFLTAKQIERLGVCHYQTAIIALKSLREIGITENIDIGTIPKMGKVDNLHFLTTKGAKLLAENSELEEIQHPANKNNFFSSDFIHRINTLDCWIAFELWTQSKGYDVDFVDAYFLKNGSIKGGGLQARTRLIFEDGTYYEPDLIARYYDNDGKGHLFVLELYNDISATRPLKSLKKNLKGLLDGSATEKYEHGRGYRVLSVFNTGNVMENTIKRMQNDSNFENMKPYFLFKTLGNINDFGERWSLNDFEFTDL